MRYFSSKGGETGMLRKVRVWPLGAAFALLSLAVPATAQPSAPGDQSWVYTYGASGQNPTGNALVSAPVGDDVFLAGSLAFDFFVVRLDGATGAALWSATYDDPVGGVDDPLAIAVSPDGTRVFVTGQSATSDYFAPDFATVALDAATGARRWVRRFDSGGGSDVAKAVAVSPDGTIVYVTGTATPPEQYADIVTFAYDAADGHQLWRQIFDGPNGKDDLAVGIAVGPLGGKVYVTGTSMDYIDLQSWYDYVTVAYASSTGEEAWRKGFAGPSNHADLTKDVTVSRDGRTVFVTGTSFNGYSDDLTTIAYRAATGAVRWKSLYDSTYHGSDQAADFELSPDGSQLFVTGRSSGSNGFDDYITVAYRSANGTRMWARRLGSQNTDWAYAVTVSPDGGRVFVTGRLQERDSVYSDYGTAAYDAQSGSLEWIQRYTDTPTSTESAVDVVATTDGTKVVVTGSNQPFRAVTVGYSIV
jgi:hypothetical protein